MDWTVGAARDLGIDNSQEWDGQNARDSIFAWAGGPNGAEGEFDAARARRGFLVYDADEPDLKGSYKLPFAHAVGGELKASPAGLRAAARRLPQTDIPADVEERARAVLDGYFERLDDDEESARSKRGIMTAPPTRLVRQAELLVVDDDRSGRFVASTNRIDLYGDIIEQNWDLADFWRNPVFLWGHASWATPIGWVREFEPSEDRSETRSRVEFLPEGTDEFVDKLYRLTKLGAIRAVSVGFVPLETEDRFDDEHRWLGMRILRSRLIELSLCTIPANPDAVHLARSIDPHPAFLRRVIDSPLTGSGGQALPRPAAATTRAAPQPRGFTLRDAAVSRLTHLKARKRAS